MRKMRLFCLLLIFVAACQPKSVEIKDSYADVKSKFENPPMEYRSMPLWVWNARMTKEMIEEQLKDFKDKGIGGVFVHPRPGLITPYLSQEWYDMFKYAISVGKKLGMQVWIYDENSYPSGFAGGHVPDQMPEAVGKMIRQEIWEQIPDTNLEIVAVMAREGDQFRDITSSYKADGKTKGKYYVYHLMTAGKSPWYGGFSYVDIMQRKVTEKFLDITLGGYKKQFGEEFGKTVPGSFQDEAQISPVWGNMLVNYTPALFQEFQKRWGYDLKSKLPLLYENIGDYKTVRYHFYKTTLHLFIEGWAKTYRDYCAKNNLIFTGHYWEHEWPIPRIGPDNMAMEEFNDMPGIDILFNQFGNGWGGQFGLDRSVKELRSVGNQLGKRRLMSETYGGAGWDITFADQRRIADWEFVLGINFINQHLQHATLVGSRKADYPQTFSYHEPWWNNYKVMGDYLGRMSLFATLGEQINTILMIEPTTSLWMRYTPQMVNTRWDSVRLCELAQIGNQFHKFVRKMEGSQIEYDLGSEQIIKNHGKIDKDLFTVGNRSYSLVVLPPFMENIDSATFSLLQTYLKNGGKVLSYQVPGFLNGKASEAAIELASKYPKQWIQKSDTADISPMIEETKKNIQFNIVSPGVLYHHRRMLKEAQLILLVNSSDVQESSGSFTVNGKSVEQWNALDGKISQYPFITEGENIKCNFSIPAKGSILLCVKKTEEPTISVSETIATPVKALDSIQVERMADNVLVLNYCDLKIKNKTIKDLYFYDAQTKTYVENGWSYNPWDHAVQFKSSIIDADTFKRGTGYEATYRFTVEKGTDINSLKAVVEQPKIFKVSVNKKIIESNGKWWIDKDFGVYDIGAFVKAGENTLTISVDPFTLLAELEPIFILGNFSSIPAKRGFAIAEKKPLSVGSWIEMGMPFYGHQVQYSQSFKTENTTAARYIVKLGKWDGTVAEVNVNGKKAGVIVSPPYELDVTELIEPDVNKISVSVTGSFKNTFGPFFNSNPGAMSPWDWRVPYSYKNGYPSGKDYSLYKYGLYEPFNLLAKMTK